MPPVFAPFGFVQVGDFVVPVTIPVWSVGGATSCGRSGQGGAGELNSGLIFGGIAASSTNSTEEYDGSSWSGGGNLISARYAMGSAGTQNAALSFGGTPSSGTEEYDGGSWSTGGGMIAARANPGGAGTQNAALGFGGGGNTTCTEEYNGASWAIGGALINQRANIQGQGVGTQNAALAISTPTAPVQGPMIPRKPRRLKKL